MPTPGSSDMSPENTFLEEAEDSDLSDDELLEFRERHLPNFPLMHLTSDVTAAELQREKPVLSLAIHGLVTKVASQKIVLGKRLREVLTHKILVDGERSMDLLLSLLTSIAWYESLLVCLRITYSHTLPGLYRSHIGNLSLGQCWAWLDRSSVT
jgi:hypothetical protein